MKLDEQLYMVRMQVEQIARAPWDADDSGVHQVEVHYKQPANKLVSAPGLYRLAGAKAALRHWSQQHAANKWFVRKFDILPVFIEFGDPL